MKSYRKLAVVFVVALTLGCGSGGGGNGFNLISLEEEWQLGAQLSRDIAAQMRLNNDPAVNAYVNEMGRRIVAQTEMAHLPWQFHVVDDPAINAFNIPGGHVYVNTGLIAAADNASELAGVMAHEIAHGVSRHGTEQLSRQYGLSILAGLVLGQNPQQYQAILANILAGGTLARFSREAEHEADDRGVQYMAKAGYNPRGMATMFEELLAQRRGRPSSVEQFFSTHPLTEDRIRRVNERAAQVGGSNLMTDEPAYQSVRSRVRG